MLNDGMSSFLFFFFFFNIPFFNFTGRYQKVLRVKQFQDGVFSFFQAGDSIEEMFCATFPPRRLIFIKCSVCLETSFFLRFKCNSFNHRVAVWKYWEFKIHIFTNAITFTQSLCVFFSLWMRVCILAYKTKVTVRWLKHPIRGMPTEPRIFITTSDGYHIYQPLRSGRIWHKVNF